MDKKITIIISVLLYFITVYFSRSYFAQGKTVPTNSSLTVSEKYIPPSENGNAGSKFAGPKTEECPINGEMLTKEQKALWEKRRPLIVMIENHVDSRPQSGLTSADVIYEAVAEGGITRMAVVFYCKDVPYIGPVRSARVYFVDFAAGYGDYPLYAHVGGANTSGPANALGKIDKLGWGVYNDLNQFGIPFPYYWRDTGRLASRATEHTVYSSTKKLWKYARKERGLTNKDADGEPWDKNFTKWKFKDDEAIDDPIGTISFSFWDGKPNYNVKWIYSPETNTYKRFHGEEKHIDNNNKKQITAKNVIIAFMSESSANDGYSGGHLLYKTTGSGSAIVFQDGMAVKATWKKRNTEDRMKFISTAGREIELNRGQVWIEIVPKGNNIDY